MKRKSSNYLDYDHINIRVRVQLSQKIKEYYQNFGWIFEAEEEDKKYSDVVNISFTRPHFIKNKDYLQLLQVRLENMLNKIDEYKTKQYSRALVWGLIFGFLSLFIVATGVLLSIFLPSFIYVICSIVLCSLGIGTSIFAIIKTKKVVKSDREKYKKLQESANQIIQKINQDVIKIMVYSNG